MPQVYGLSGLVDVPDGAIEARGAPAASFVAPIGQIYADINTSPPTLYFYNGSTWVTGGNNLATTTDPGIVLIDLTVTGADTDATVPTSKAVFDYGQTLVIAGANIAQTGVTGITNLATDVQAVAGTATVPGVTALAVQPSNLAAVFAAPPTIGGTTPASAAFADISATGVGTGNILTSDTASSFGTTGAGVDATIASAAGRVIINGEEAAANAITLLSAAGGIDADAALQINITSSQNAGDALRFLASAGGIDIDAVGAAGEDISIVNTGGSLILQATESDVNAIVINASGAAGGINVDAGTNGFIVDTTGAISLDATAASNFTATGVFDLTLASTGGRVIVNGEQAVANAVTLLSAAGGIDADAALQINIASSQNAADALRFLASAGGIDIDAVGAAGEDISIVNTGGSLILQATESDVNAIVINASGAAGGINVDAGTNGFIVDTTGGISLDSAAASNFTATGAFDITLQSTAGSLLFNAGETAADALNFDAAAGGFDVDVALQLNLDSSQAAATAVRIIASAANGGMDLDAGTGGMTLDSTGAVSIDGAAASNFSVSGAGIDLTLASASGSVPISAGEAVANAIGLQAAAGGIDIDGALQVNIASSQNAADAIVISSSGGGIDLTAAGAAGEDIDLVCTAGSINLTAGESIATSMVFTNNGMDIAIAGAAGRDFDLTNTGGSVNIIATESVSDAIVINASGAAGGLTLDAGTNGITLGSGLKVPVTAVATAGGTYTILNTDYFITTDSTGGAFQVDLPATPVAGMVYVVYDGAGQAAAGGNITISGNGNNIAAGGTSAATKLINTAYESYILTWNGTLWCGQNIV